MLELTVSAQVSTGSIQIRPRQLMSYCPTFRFKDAKSRTPSYPFFVPHPRIEDRSFQHVELFSQPL